MVDDFLITLYIHALYSGASELLVRSYAKSFNGFAAKLSDEEVKKIASKGTCAIHDQLA